MTENQEEGKKSSRGGNKTDEREHHSDVEMVSEDRHKYGRTISEPPPNLDRDQDQTSARRKPALVRSKTFDHSLLRDPHPDCEPKIERKKSHYSQLSKSNGHYHKIFKEISKEEQLRQSYTCALQKDILYQGRMFVSEHWICFHSKVFGKDTKIVIPVVSVTNIKKTKTALLLPNALVIATANDRYVFVSFMSRDNTYKFLLSVCLHLEEKSPCSSPIPSSLDNSFRGQRSPQSPRFPLVFAEVDLVDLDGGVRHRQELEESSSSDSQTPDYDKINAFPVPEFLEVLNHTEAPPSPKVCEKQTKQQQQQQQTQTTDKSRQQGASHTGSEIVLDGRTLKPMSLNSVLCVYLLLVCMLLLSSCYLAYKVISLEQRLSTLGPIPEFTEQHDVLRATAELNSDLFSELITINLLKLEKVQRNLQRLLEEAA